MMNDDGLPIGPYRREVSECQQYRQASFGFSQQALHFGSNTFTPTNRIQLRGRFSSSKRTVTFLENIVDLFSNVSAHWRSLYHAFHVTVHISRNNLYMGVYNMLSLKMSF